MMRSITLLSLLLLGCRYEGDNAGECADGADNDRNGLFDCDDPGCQAAPDCSGTAGTVSTSISTPTSTTTSVTSTTTRPPPNAATRRTSSSTSATSSRY